MGGGRMGVREFFALSHQFCWELKLLERLLWELKLLERLLWERSKVFSLLVASNHSFFLWEKKNNFSKKISSIW